MRRQSQLRWHSGAGRFIAGVGASVWAAASFLVASTSLAAPPVAMIDYVIQPGDTCSGIAAKMYRDKLRYDIIHDYNPQLGSRPPHSLVDGDVLRLPKTLPPDAWVTGTRRQVEHRPSVQGEWRQSKTGTQLRLGFRVTTRAESAAELTFQDDSQLQLREDTLIILYGKGASGARRKTSRARLERGALRGRLAELAGKKSKSTLLVSTPSGESSMASGEAVFSVDAEGANSVSNHSSRSIQVTGTVGRAVKVSKGMGTRVKRGEAPAKPRKLPPAPKWWGVKAMSLQAARAEDVVIRGRWSAKGERVRISMRTLASPTPLAEAEVDADTDMMRLRGLPAGTYAVTLSTIDALGLESVASDAMTVDVQAATGPVPLSVGAALPLPAGSRCAGADGVQTDRPAIAVGVQTLTCIDTEGAALAPLTVTVSAAEAQLVEPKSAKAGKTAKLRIKLTGEGLPPTLDVVLSDGQRIPLKPTKKGWMAQIAVPANAPPTMKIEVRDPDMRYGAPVAEFELSVKGGAR